MSLYRVCQVAGWSLVGLVTAAVPILYGGFRWPVLARAVLGVILGVVFTDLLRSHMWRRGWPRLPLRQLAPRVTVASLAIAAAMVLGVSPLLVLLIPSPNHMGAFLAVFAFHAAFLVGWSTIYLGYHYLRQIRTAEAEQWRLQLAMRETELHALRAQLNPHFLFNSLNSLRGLIGEDPARAQRAVTGLAGLLRHTLRLSQARTTTLESELDAARHYLDLEALRFESRLRYGIDVDPRALQHPVPPMLVQTLVENAIKHGIAQLPDGGSVGIAAWKEPSGELHLRVTNTGTISGKGAVGGIGLANAVERLRLVFGDRVSLALAAAGPDVVTCDVVVPLPASGMVAS